MVDMPISRPKRWSQALDSRMDDVSVAHALGHWPLNKVDPRLFTASLPLRGLIQNDMRLDDFAAGEVIIRAGDYGNTAFILLAGEVERLLAPGLPPEMLGRASPDKKSFFHALAKKWRNAVYPEVRRLADNSMPSPGNKQQLDLPKLKQSHLGLQTETDIAPTLFGVLATIGRTERKTTIVAKTAVQVLEVRWQALRDISRRSPGFKTLIDQHYRRRSLADLLDSSLLFKHLHTTEKAQIAAAVSFETYGDFEWQSKFQARTVNQVANPVRARQIESEIVLVDQGDYADGLLLISNGSARLSHRLNNGHRTVSFLGAGDVFGLDELLDNWQNEQQAAWTHSLRCLGYTDVVRVPTKLVEQLIFARLSPSEIIEIKSALGQGSRIVSSASGTRKDQGLQPLAVDLGLTEFFVEQRFTNGSQTMLIDLDHCVRCDECVTACAQSHNNNPRFIRHGQRHGRYMVANACMHCYDPVCMIGCPTGAIHRAPSGEVIINDTTCIGCASCANGCPYDNIRMVEIRDQQGELILDGDTQAPILKASKCDLCFDQPGKPACQRACPHDALQRLDLGSMNTSRIS